MKSLSPAGARGLAHAVPPRSNATLYGARSTFATDNGANRDLILIDQTSLCKNSTAKSVSAFRGPLPGGFRWGSARQAFSLWPALSSASTPPTRPDQRFDFCENSIAYIHSAVNKKMPGSAGIGWNGNLRLWLTAGPSRCRFVQDFLCAAPGAVARSTQHSG